MPASTTTSFTSDAAISTYYDGLQSAHALERQAISSRRASSSALRTTPKWSSCCAPICARRSGRSGASTRSSIPSLRVARS